MQSRPILKPVWYLGRIGWGTLHSNSDIIKSGEPLVYDPEWSFERGIKEAIEWYRTKKIF